MPSGDVLGTVARLQVQRGPLKPGPRGARAYDPSPLLEVPELEVGPRGVVGPDRVLDVHHADHPLSRNVRLCNGLSVLPRSHYALLRARFGPHVVDGCAGENLLLDTDRPLRPEDVAGTLLLETEEGEPLVLTAGQAAAPCVEFSRWLLGQGPQDPLDDDVRETLEVLADGVRGFYLSVEGTGRVARGARLSRA